MSAKYVCVIVLLEPLSHQSTDGSAVPTDTAENMTGCDADETRERKAHKRETVSQIH